MNDSYIDWFLDFPGYSLNDYTIYKFLKGDRQIDLFLKPSTAAEQSTSELRVINRSEI